MKSSVLWFIIGVAVATAAKLPDGFKLCHKADADYKECLPKAASGGIRKFAEGDSSLGVSSLEPLELKQVHIPGNGGSIDLEQNYNMTIHGLTKGNVNNVELDMDNGKCHIHMESVNPHLELVGQYKATGKLMLFTLNGFGAFNITNADLKVTHDIECEKYDKKGKQYIKVKEHKIDMNAGKVYYDFENLVNGNAQLSAEVLKVMNDNNKEVFEALKPDFQQAIGAIFVAIANQLFSKIPAEVFFS